MQMSLLFSVEYSADLIQKLLRGSQQSRANTLKTIPRLVLANGSSLSVQASDFHRCEPRNQTGPYTSCEVGLPSRVFPELLPYMEHENGVDPLNAVYNYVPISVIMEIVLENGGLRL